MGERVGPEAQVAPEIRVGFRGSEHEQSGREGEGHERAIGPNDPGRRGPGRAGSLDRDGGQPSADPGCRAGELHN